MATDLSASFNEQYININTKLKKRFLRKPNISEATNEFIALAIQCEHSEQPSFAGQTYIGAAKCEASAGNFLGEAEQHLAAARQFMKAEKKLAALKFDSPDRENLEAAIGCYMWALVKYPEKSPLRTSILLELAEGLVDLNYKNEALVYYEEAVDSIEDKTMKLMCFRNMFNLLLDCDKYEQALDTANLICDSNFHIPEGVLTEIQVCRILLVLLVNPDEDTKSESLKLLLHHLLNDEQSDSIPFNTDLRLKLQSIIISSSARDQPALISVAADTKQHLTVRQKDLLQTLVLLNKPE
ncbi:40-kDa huntingtin-associated protein-like [Maniola hyperantus]|uniref:40-kDa huntingtin-associated protein-like n=1 Tax=Aphantopus hyperantus TaxID=2795564 RepID=UPI0015692029|nr:40-kDa huntingtin-associated protein [Maniola hyperantus]